MPAIDADIWVYYLDSDLPEHDRVSQRLTETLGSRPLFVNTAIQMEVVHYLSRQLSQFDAVATQFLELGGVTVGALKVTDVAQAATLLDDHRDVGIGGRDASLVASMARHEVTELWTHDEALKRLEDRVGWLTVTDPTG